jgi:glycine/D-amino acid oxidase-like deaminating enzyme/nitrite reductase/ring-hydroxylating ferredoxin subunit
VDARDSRTFRLGIQWTTVAAEEQIVTTTANESLWLQGTERGKYPAAEGEVLCEVAVVGGGITGLTTALLLKHLGVRVALIEAGTIGAGVSGNNTAKVTALQATTYSTIRNRHGDDAAADYASASAAGVEKVAELAATEEIDCDLQRRPAYTYAIDESEVAAVRKEAEAAAAAGLPVVLDDGGGLGVPFPVHGAVRLDNQVLLHPGKYTQGLAAALDGDGCLIFENSRVLHVDSGKQYRLRTSTGTVVAQQVVIATHYPILDRGLFFARLEPTRAYCVAARLRTGSPPHGLGISAGNPSWSLGSAGDLLVLCGQSHPTGRRDIGRPYQRLADFAHRHWDIEQITHRWSAQDPSSYDRLPMIGSYLPGSTGLHVATGFMKWGLSTGTFAAMILADLIAGKENPWAHRFSPHRLSVRSAPTLARMNLKVAADLVGDRLRPADAGTPQDVAPGQARVVRDGRGKTGVYRDMDGTLHAVSLRCTHLGCLLRFNDAEHSWDCPCHGSRFDVDGTVLEGPASRSLPGRDPQA